MTDDRLAVFDELLGEPRWLDGYLALSRVLIGRGSLETWLGRGYFATLAAGSLAPADLGGEGGARAAATLARFLAADRLYTDASGVPLARTVTQLLPATGYAPPYAPADVKEMLAAFATLPAGASVEQVRTALLTDPTSGASSTSGVAIATRQATALWYASALIDLTSSYGWIIKRAPIQTYDSALVFAVIGAPATGMPGPYYGNWAYPPPEVVVEPDRPAPPPRLVQLGVPRPCKNVRAQEGE
jgi:hypothetical protein